MEGMGRSRPTLVPIPPPRNGGGHCGADVFLARQRSGMSATDGGDGGPGVAPCPGIPDLVRIHTTLQGAMRANTNLVKASNLPTCSRRSGWRCGLRRGRV